MGLLQGISGLEAAFAKSQRWDPVSAYDLMKGLKCQAKESALEWEGTGSHMGLEGQECHDRLWQPGGKWITAEKEWGRGCSKKAVAIVQVRKDNGLHQVSSQHSLAHRNRSLGIWWKKDRSGWIQEIFKTQNNNWMMGLYTNNKTCNWGLINVPRPLSNTFWCKCIVCKLEIY